MWKFDEELNARMDWDMDPAADAASIQIPMALIYGANSESFSSKSADHMKSLAPSLEVVELAMPSIIYFLISPKISNRYCEKSWTAGLLDRVDRETYGRCPNVLIAAQGRR